MYVAKTCSQRSWLQFLQTACKRRRSRRSVSGEWRLHVLAYFCNPRPPLRSRSATAQPLAPRSAPLFCNTRSPFRFALPAPADSVTAHSRTGPRLRHVPIYLCGVNCFRNFICLRPIACLPVFVFDCLVQVGI